MSKTLRTDCTDLLTGEIVHVIVVAPGAPEWRRIRSNCASVLRGVKRPASRST